jgi:hypothetical protein
MAGPVTDQPQLPGFCWRCLDTGQVRNYAYVAGLEGRERVTWTSPCPDCKPPPSARETWMEVARLGRRPS